jgi:hypothetical protein
VARLSALVLRVLDRVLGPPPPIVARAWPDVREVCTWCGSTGADADRPDAPGWRIHRDTPPYCQRHRDARQRGDAEHPHLPAIERAALRWNQ